MTALRTALAAAMLVAIALPPNAATSGEAPPPLQSEESVQGYDPITGMTWTEPPPAFSPQLPLPGRYLDGEDSLTAGESARPSTIFGADDRDWVQDTTTYPWKTFCKVKVQFPSGKRYTGSAVIVGPRHALTAGHIVYKSDEGGWASSIEITPGYENGWAPYGRVYGERMWTFTGWTQNEDFDDDMAFVQLSSDIGNQTGWLGLDAASDEVLDGALVNTAGYPGDLPADSRAGEFMYRASGYCTAYTNRLHFAGTFDVYPGQSGSGVYLYRNGERHVVAVVAWERIDTNGGTRLTSSKLAYVRAWRDAYESPADLRAVACTATLGSPSGSVDPGATGTATVTVANDGDQPATVAVVVELDPAASGSPVTIGSTTVSVSGHGTVYPVVAVTVPAGIPSGSYRLTATVNGNRAFAEADHSDNSVAGETLTVTAPWEQLPLGWWTTEYLDTGEEMPRRISVPANRRKLKIRFKGYRWSTGYIEDPFGRRYPVTRTKGKRVFRQPPAGEWKVMIVGGAYARASRHKVKAKVK